MDEQPSTHIPVTYDRCAHVEGPFYHGTRTAFDVGDELVAGHGSNFHQGRVSNNLYFSALVETAAARRRSWPPRWPAATSAGTSTSSSRWARSRTTPT